MIDELGSGKWMTQLLQEHQAAMIEALRDQVVPEAPHPVHPDPTLFAARIDLGRWIERQHIRALLTEQARIAREGA